MSDSDIQEYPSEIHLDFPASWPRGTGWDNLSAHISKLAEAGYLAVKNPIVNKKTHTVAALTDTGRAAFERYREQTMAVLDTD